MRNVFVVGPDKKIKLMLIYPMTTGRNFDEVLRVIDSLQLTAKHKVATPANWKQGEDVIIAGSVSDDEAKTKYPEGWKAPRPYLRIVPQPEGEMPALRRPPGDPPVTGDIPDPEPRPASTPSIRRWSRCSRDGPARSPRARVCCSSPSGTASARSSFAAAAGSTSRAASCGRSIATSPRCTTPPWRSCPPAASSTARSSSHGDGLDFDALQMRLHPAASRVEKLAEETPASFVAFDLLAADGRDLRECRRPSGARGSSGSSPGARRRST